MSEIKLKPMGEILLKYVLTFFYSKFLYITIIIHDKKWHATQTIQTDKKMEHRDNTITHHSGRCIC